jgi:universal stress protein E
MFNRIVVLPAGTSVTQPALQRAALCARPTTDVVVLEIAHEPMLDGYFGNKDVYEPLRRRVVAERRQCAAGLAAWLEQRGLEARPLAVWAERREDAIAECVRAEQADLVVTTPLLDGAHGALSASDWRLLATCPAPVLVVKGAGDRPYRNIVAAVDPFHAHAKPAELDKKILAAAAAMQAQTRANLTVLHCFTPPEYFREDARLAPRDEEIESRRRTALEDLLRDAGMPATAARVVPGAPHDVLQAMAEKGEADLIVMGALARGRLKDWLIGSTAERVLYRTQVDVLTVNPAR